MHRVIFTLPSSPGIELQPPVILTGKILPGLVGEAKISRSLQHPEVRTRGIGKLDQDICYMEELKERNTELVGCLRHPEKQREFRGIQVE